MSAVVFDTRTYVKRLVSVGFTEPQADTPTEEQFTPIDDQLATKRDMNEMETRLEQRLTFEDALLRVGKAAMNPALISHSAPVSLSARRATDAIARLVACRDIWRGKADARRRTMA